MTLVQSLFINQRSFYSSVVLAVDVFLSLDVGRGVLIIAISLSVLLALALGRAAPLLGRSLFSRIAFDRICSDY